MREGTPLLAVPLIGDQLYGGYQLERLNIGRVVQPFVVPWLSSRVLRKLGKLGIRLNKREFVNKIQEVLTDETVLENSLQFSRVMRMGGGVEASTALIERLAWEQECVSTCVAPNCCC
jgi:UDP:flavonoid glycosyltransferase YjiC (YdhE family)